MSFALAQTAAGEAASYIRSQDYSTALDRLMEAQAYLLAIPDSQKDGSVLTFGRNIDAQIKALERRETRAATQSATGLQQIPVTYARPSGATCDE